MKVLQVGADSRPVGFDAHVVSSGVVIGAVAFHHIQRKIVVGVGAGVGIYDAETSGGVRRLSEQFQAAPHQAVITENRQIDVVLDDGVAYVHAALTARAVDERVFHVRRLRPLAHTPDFRQNGVGTAKPSPALRWEIRGTHIEGVKSHVLPRISDGDQAIARAARTGGHPRNLVLRAQHAVAHRIPAELLDVLAIGREPLGIGDVHGGPSHTAKIELRQRQVHPLQVELDGETVRVIRQAKGVTAGHPRWKRLPGVAIFVPTRLAAGTLRGVAALHVRPTAHVV